MVFQCIDEAHSNHCFFVKNMYCSVPLACYTRFQLKLQMAPNGGCSLCYYEAKLRCPSTWAGRLTASAPSLSLSARGKIHHNLGTILSKIPGIGCPIPHPPACIQSVICSRSAWVGAELSRHRKRRHGRG